MNQKVISRDMYYIGIKQDVMFGNLRSDTKVYITKQGADGKMYKAKLEWEEAGDFLNSTVEPVITESLGMYETSHIVEHLKHSLEEQNLINKTEPITGKLEATEKHLEDMRKLVFEETVQEITMERK